MDQGNWLAFGAVLVLALLAAWWLFARASRAAKLRKRRPDVLDEGATPAQRNQALIDAPSAAIMASPATMMPPPMSIDMAGIGEVVAIGAEEEVEAATAAGARQAQDAAPADAPADELTRIKGIGPKLKGMLHSLGVTRFEQIAAWTDEDIARIDPQLGAFQGRIVRDNWVEQARYLATGDAAGFEGKFGKL